MLYDEIKKMSITELKAGNKNASNLYRLVLSEVQRSDKTDDEHVMSVIKKMIKSNNETLDGMRSGTSNQWEDQVSLLIKDNELLEQFLPKQMDENELRTLILSSGVDIYSAKSSGQATGMVMRELKNNGLVADGNLVKAVVTELMEKK